MVCPGGPGSLLNVMLDHVCWLGVPSHYGSAGCQTISAEPCEYLVLRFWDRLEFPGWCLGFTKFMRTLLRLRCHVRLGRYQEEADICIYIYIYTNLSLSLSLYTYIRPQRETPNSVFCYRTFWTHTFQAHTFWAHIFRARGFPAHTFWAHTC